MYFIFSSAVLYWAKNLADVFFTASYSDRRFSSQRVKPYRFVQEVRFFKNQICIYREKCVVQSVQLVQTVKIVVFKGLFSFY